MPDSQKPKFFEVMMGSRARLWTTLFAIVLIVSVWQRSSVTLVPSDWIPTAVVLAREEAQFVTLILLAGFGPGFIILLIWRRVVERQPLMTLFTGMARFRWRLVIASAFTVGAICLAITLAFDPQSVSQIKGRMGRFSPADWALLTLAYSLGIGVQATFEEVLVRGWLGQHIRRFMPNALGVILLTSLVFAAMHFRHHGWATYAIAFTFGLAFGWSAVRLNGLEAAIGAHAANNLVGALLAGQMIVGNPAAMDVAQLIQLCIYVLGFLVFVEVWARFFEKPSRG